MLETVVFNGFQTCNEQQQKRPGKKLPGLMAFYTSLMTAHKGTAIIPGGIELLSYF